MNDNKSYTKDLKYIHFTGESTPHGKDKSRSELAAKVKTELHKGVKWKLNEKTIGMKKKNYSNKMFLTVNLIFFSSNLNVFDQQTNFFFRKWVDPF